MLQSHLLTSWSDDNQTPEQHEIQFIKNLFLNQKYIQTFDQNIECTECQ